MEEGEDIALLSRLGVTSANPDDIERHILAEAENNDGNSNAVGGSGKEETPGDLDNTDPSSALQVKLFNKLNAVEFEINAVASTVDRGKESDDNAENSRDIQNVEGYKNGSHDFPKDSSLQHALAADRLSSLKQTKAQLEKELSDLCEGDSSKGIKRGKLLQSLVRENPRAKRKSKKGEKQGKSQEKRLKTGSYDYDVDLDFGVVMGAASAGFVETERDELIRKGVFTPFHKLKGFERRLQQPGPSNIPEEEDKNDAGSDIFTRAVKSVLDAAKSRPTTKLLDPEALPMQDAPTFPFHRLKTPLKIPRSPEGETENPKGLKKKKKRPLPDNKWRKRIAREENHLEEIETATINSAASSGEEENQGNCEDLDDKETPYVALEGGLNIPERIFSKLFDYQKVGVQWLWELHCQKAGGIIGDEMGLGKTIQVISFLGALHFSNMYEPSIVICPVTLVRQWRREVQKWYPDFHVEILHDSAHDSSTRKKQGKFCESDYETEASDSDFERNDSSKSIKRWDSLINRILKSKAGLLITTYEQLRLLGEKLLDVEWGYAVLDEGHRIRNPNAEVTLVCKQLQTVHRIIMTGAPIQNKLTEVWSLFDFVFPGKLGVLPIFEAEFAVPISVGGYANASPLQVSTAYRCAVVLRDLIMPYLLRRMKADVNAHLPKKTEHVLFCSLSPEQRSVYRAFLASSDVEQILDGNRNSLYGIDVLRKICNHPDLLEREHAGQNPDYGNPERSGKMKVVSQVLTVWKEQGHRVLLFSQTQQMLDILEKFLTTCGYNYRRMDGLTPVKQRMALIDEFNNSEDVFVFILTTKVGGLGTNLTGGNRVIIYDPDWNPSNDMQARERAWRIGQKKDVTVYRLITRGTIEEKIYHRQIYKHFLTNKVLKNPQQRRFFKSRDMKDLFTLKDDGDCGSTETSNIFGQLSENVNVVGAQPEKYDKKKHGKATLCHADLAAGENGNNGENGLSRKKEKETTEHGDCERDDETKILKNLFDAHGIHSAVNHDVIMEAHDEEKLRLEEQASQVAQRAAEALRHSRMLRSSDSISVPTWTGKSGTAGAPSSVRRKFGSSVNSQLIKSPGESFNTNTRNSISLAAGASAGRALSSAELLNKIRGSQESAAGAALDWQIGKNTASMQPEVLIRKICTFIQERGGSTGSNSIVQHFKDRVPSSDLPLFKNLLREIAKLEKNPNGSVWVLKPEYLQRQ